MGQKRKNIVFFVRMAAFLVIFGLLFAPLKELVCRKSLTGTWDMTNKVGGFYNEPEGEFEILFLGSSHSYAAFSPLRLWEDTGIKSYVFATQRQPLWATYAYLLEALKTQSPKLVVVDCRGALEPAESFYEEGVSYSFMDDIPFSLNKVRLAWVSGQTMEERAELLCNFIKYHGRWADLEDADWEFDRGALHDPYKGYVFLPDKEEEYPVFTYLVEGFRQAFISNSTIITEHFGLYSIIFWVITILMFLWGNSVFKRNKKDFADVL